MTVDDFYSRILIEYQSILSP